MQTIEENFGVFIDHTVQVSLCAFKSLVDAVGGVNVPFAYPTRDDDDRPRHRRRPAASPSTATRPSPTSGPAGTTSTSTDKGWQTDGTSDYGRIARQQDFIQRALQKAVDKGARNVGVARDLLDVALANVVVDQNLTINDLLRLASTLRDFDPAQLRAHSYRVEGRGATQGGESVIIPDVEAPTTKAILEVFRGHARLSDVPPADATTTTRRARRRRRDDDHGADHDRGDDHDGGGRRPRRRRRPGATTTVPVVDVAPNPLGISPPDDPTCR